MAFQQKPAPIVCDVACPYPEKQVHSFPAEEAILMSIKSFDCNENSVATQPAAGRTACWARHAAVIATVAVFLGTLGITSSFAAGTVAPAATGTPMALSLPAATATAASSRLGSFDTALLTLINAKRATTGAVALREVVGLDDVSATWSSSVVAKGRYGTVVPNANIASQTLSAAPDRSAFAQSVAKWYPQSVKVADVFALYTGYPKTMADMTNRNYKYVGVRTVAAADGTSVATLTFTDTAVAAQIVDPSTAYNPTGALTSAVQAGASVALKGKASDPDAAALSQVKVTDTVAGKVASTIAATVSNGVFATTVPLVGYGTHSICATVVNQGAGANLSLGCTTARLGTLIGSADTLRQSGQLLTATGWGYDPAAPTAALKGTVTVTGPSGSRTLSIVSNVDRADVARAYPGAGPAHGYRIAVPTLGKGINKMCVTLAPASSTSVVRHLACRTITVS